MTFVKTEKGYILRLIKGEKIIETLTHFCDTENIHAGWMSGLGGAEQIELGYYNLETKQYQWKTFEKIHEIVSLTGNISLVDEIPFLHIHIVISDDQFQTYAGHLKEAIVGATCEVFITPVDIEMKRTLDDEIGLKLLKFEK